MLPLGYLYKRVASESEWLRAPQVRDIYSLSSCMSHDFADYINYWKHNGYWLFDSPAVISRLAADEAISLDGLKLFYYEAYELQYQEETRAWLPFEPEQSFGTHVVVPVARTLEGFDVTSFTVGNEPEHSPLSCNALARELPTNEHCLFSSFEEAKQAIEQDEFRGSEPGPYRIIAVYSVYGPD